MLQVLHLLLPINVLPVNMLICQRKRRRKGVQRQESLINRKKFMLQTDPVVATSACVGHSTPSTFAVSATYHTGNGNIGCLVEHCSFDKFSSFEF